MCGGCWLFCLIRHPEKKGFVFFEFGGKLQHGVVCKIGLSLVNSCYIIYYYKTVIVDESCIDYGFIAYSPIDSICTQKSELKFSRLGADVSSSDWRHVGPEFNSRS